MHSFSRGFVFAFFPFLLLLPAVNLNAQTAAGTITGTVTDGSGAVIPDATVTIENPVSGLKRSAKTDAAGQYKFTNLPLNPYHLVAHAPGFAEFSTDVPVRSSVAVTPNTSRCR
jgi:protocatechuate 3,4-dioxygenase beta subunit